jgi:elongation factor Ts
MSTTLEKIKTLIKETGAGVMESRQALEEAHQNYDEALAALREKVAARVKAKAGNDTQEGFIEHYSHCHGRIGVMVEVNTETDFAAESEIVKNFAHEVAMQIASSEPLYVSDEDIPGDVLQELTAKAQESARSAGKPEAVIAKIVEGSLEKYKNNSVLLRQPYIRDESLTIAQLREQAAGRLRENINIRRFVRWETRAAQTAAE